MNNEIKVNLTVILQGGVTFSEQECSGNPKKDIKGVGFDTVMVDVARTDKTLLVPIKMCKQRQATQTLKINMEAYEYMTGQECPYFLKPGQWKNMGKTTKLEAHLDRICKSLNGLSYTYVVLEG